MSVYYQADQCKDWTAEQFAWLCVELSNHSLRVRLNNPARKNALNPALINELAYAAAIAQYDPQIWSFVLAAEGDVFCSGADLKAFAGQDDGRNSQVPPPSGEVLLGDLFQQLYKPSVALVQGDVFAGGFLLLTGCRMVIARKGIRLGLPEVKRGLFPFQVMAGLLEVLPPRKVADWCIRGYDLPAEEALQLGLITELAAAEDLEQRLSALLDELHDNSPSAIRMGLEAFAKLRSKSASSEHAYLKGMLMQVLQTRDAMEGIAAFKEKRKPSWTGE